MGSTAITFPGAQGHALAARLDVPSDSQYAAGVLDRKSTRLNSSHRL